MNVVDKIVTEWAFRCKKGYPDTNNPDDMKILKEIYSEYGIVMEEDREQEEESKEKEELLQNLIKMLNSPEKKENLSLDFLTKIYASVEQKGKGLGAEIKKIIIARNLQEFQGYIFSAINSELGEETFLEFYNEPSKHITLDDIKKGDLYSIVEKKTGLPRRFLQPLYEIKTARVGKGEVFLALLSQEGIFLPVKGDVEIQGKKIEVKADGGRLGGQGGDSGANLKALYNKLEELVPNKPLNKNLSKIIPDLIRNNTPESEVRAILNKEFGNKFTESKSLTDSSEIQKTLLEWYVDTFLQGDADYADLIGIVLEGEIKVYSREGFKQAVLSDQIKFSSNFTRSNKSPQLGTFK